MTGMNIHFGLETEYGITREDPEGMDVVAESIHLVRSATEPGVRMKWDYRMENPHRDMRGFSVRELRQDKDEAGYFAQDSARPMSFSEIKSDLALANGGRFYNDHAHPEYCTPECRNLQELVRQDWLGDQLARACARRINQTTDNAVILYKNNTDFLGHSYGCHENYLIPRSIEWEGIAQAMTAFLVTRQIFAGAGKYGMEDEDRYLGPGFQLSQRADFFRVLQSVDTMQRRPIINTRDEAHAEDQLWRRFHVIIGDANLSPYATWLKVGTTALVLQAIISGAPISLFPRLRDPISALRGISHDSDFEWIVGLEAGFELSATVVQRRYLDIVWDYNQDTFHEDPSWLKVFKAWDRIVQDLAEDPLSTADRLDWSAKYQLIESFRESESIKMDDPWVISLDLEYHRLDPEFGLFYSLLDAGEFKLPVEREYLEASPGLIAPADTRAAIRGLCIERFARQIKASQWDFIQIETQLGVVELNLRNLFDVGTVQHAVEAIRSMNSPEPLSHLPFARILQK